jgi:tRNA1Val (adenine37-N6)-methyltransferase
MDASDHRPFHFQQFSLYHHRSTMKVGTDAVLLGIWTPLDGNEKVLDIGTGCGILPLLLAARCGDVTVDAVDIDPDSAEEARMNFERAPFSGRLRAFQADIRNAKALNRHHYDLIVSNPPFFLNDHRPVREDRKRARHTDSLSYEDLIKAAGYYLKPGGRFSVVLPYRQSRIFLELARVAGFFVQRQMLIFPKPCKEPNRVNLLLGKNPENKMETEKFIIRDEKGNFTSQYIDMVKNYYLSTGK